MNDCDYIMFTSCDQMKDFYKRKECCGGDMATVQCSTVKDFYKGQDCCANPSQDMLNYTISTLPVPSPPPLPPSPPPPPKPPPPSPAIPPLSFENGDCKYYYPNVPMIDSTCPTYRLTLDSSCCMETMYDQDNVYCEFSITNRGQSNISASDTYNGFGLLWNQFGSPDITILDYQVLDSSIVIEGGSVVDSSVENNAIVLDTGYTVHMAEHLAPGVPNIFRVKFDKSKFFNKRAFYYMDIDNDISNDCEDTTGDYANFTRVYQFQVSTDAPSPPPPAIPPLSFENDCTHYYPGFETCDKYGVVLEKSCVITLGDTTYVELTTINTGVMNIWVNDTWQDAGHVYAGFKKKDILFPIGSTNIIAGDTLDIFNGYLRVDASVYAPMVPHTSILSFLTSNLAEQDIYSAKFEFLLDPFNDHVLDCEDTVYDRQYVLINSTAPSPPSPPPAPPPCTGVGIDIMGTDSYGDGWGADLLIPGIGLPNEIFTVDAAANSYSVCLLDYNTTCYSAALTTTTWAVEIGLSITTLTGETLYEAAGLSSNTVYEFQFGSCADPPSPPPSPPNSPPPPPPTPCTNTEILITGTDSYGDGWNGGFLVIPYINLIDDLFTITGDSGSVIACADLNNCIAGGVYGGSYGSEIGVTIVTTNSSQFIYEIPAGSLPTGTTTDFQFGNCDNTTNATAPVKMPPIPKININELKSHKSKSKPKTPPRHTRKLSSNPNPQIEKPHPFKRPSV
jgi:hypothetical protein